MILPAYREDPGREDGRGQAQPFADHRRQGDRLTHDKLVFSKVVFSKPGAEAMAEKPHQDPLPSPGNLCHSPAARPVPANSLVHKNFTDPRTRTISGSLPEDYFGQDRATRRGVAAAPR
ncbi:MAG: hypothetical protein ACOYOO_13030 [Saprospiraceae bacterium]